MRGGKIAAIDAKAAAGIHRLIGGCCKRQRTAKRAAELEREQHVLLLQRHSASGTAGIFPSRMKGPR